MSESAPPRPAGLRLRIGYVSSFFASPNWMTPVYGVVNQHDRSRFEVHLIALGPAPSLAAGYQDHAEDFIWHAHGVDNAQLACRIAGAGIDVLIDLNGYSDQRRLGLFLHRPAPVQIGWFNMFATTGMTMFDCLVGDAAVIPLAEEAFYSEPIERVSGSYLAFQVSHPVPDVKRPPCLDNGLITLGCLGWAYKITAEVVAAWAIIFQKPIDAPRRGAAVQRPARLPDVASVEIGDRRKPRGDASPPPAILTRGMCKVSDLHALRHTPGTPAAANRAR